VRVVADGALLVDLHERVEEAQSGKAGPEAPSLLLEVSPSVLDLIEESLDVSPPGDPELRPLPGVQPVLPGRGLNLCPEDVLRMPLCRVFSDASSANSQRSKFSRSTTAELAHIGPTTPKPVDPSEGASVDPTEARNDILGCFGRSDRSAHCRWMRPRRMRCRR
jgi:hypothetical protein